MTFLRSDLSPSSASTDFPSLTYAFCLLSLSLSDSPQPVWTIITQSNQTRPSLLFALGAPLSNCWLEPTSMPHINSRLIPPTKEYLSRSGSRKCRGRHWVEALTLGVGAIRGTKTAIDWGAKRCGHRPLATSPWLHFGFFRCWSLKQS